MIEVIPPVFRLAKWYIRYQIDEDGASYRYMLMELKYQSPFIIIIKDLEGEVFGAYVSAELKVNYKGFWGNGETFLFNYNQVQNLGKIIIRKMKSSATHGLRRIKISHSVIRLD